MGQTACCLESIGSMLGLTSRDAEARSVRSAHSSSRVILSKYEMFLGEDDVMGEGSYCVCRRGKCIQTGEAVAIKVYKAKKTDSMDILLKKFRRQIEVLQELQEPLKPVPGAPWNDFLGQLDPQKLFMRLIDFSRDRHGEPGIDPVDGVTYVITELGQYSLKDYLKQRKDQNDPPSKETVRVATRAILFVVAGLHAKGLVHLDLKPENLMLFDGRLKLIDVDGCVRIGTTVSVDDSSLSFSPCYCAPEWAKFLVDGSVDLPTINISPMLDVWSVGVSICEFITLEALLYPSYTSFLKHGRGCHEAAFLFLEWLSCMRKFKMPRAVLDFDPEFVDLVMNHLLVCQPEKRWSLADCLKHPFLGKVDFEKVGSEQWSMDIVRDEDHGMPVTVPRHQRHRAEDHSVAVLHKGTLWKLNSDGDPTDPSHWLKRDMWVAANGSLCYFSLREYKRLVLLDAHRMSTAKVERFEGGALPHTFQIRTRGDSSEHIDEKVNLMVFACGTEAAFDQWTKVLKRAQDAMMASMRLGTRMAQKLRDFKLQVKNRRIKLDDESDEQFEPVFKATLWKLKADGDRTKSEDWFEREMWLARNGSFVYWSEKEERQLVYYTASDVHHARVRRVPEGRGCRPWAFDVAIASTGGLEFAPGEFAAESADMREQWLAAFRSSGAKLS